ncbi:GNAT family N-acetyltransferase [Anaerolineales bacterium]
MQSLDNRDVDLKLMKFEIYRDANAFQSLADDWNELLNRSVTCTPFLSIEWISTWWNIFEPGELLILTCRLEDDRLIGIAPCFITSESDQRTLVLVGCEDITDYLDFLIDKDHQEAAYLGLSQILLEHQNEFDQIDFCNIPSESPTRSRFAALLTEADLVVSEDVQEVCPIIQLPDSWDAYLQLLNKKQRHEVRRKLRRIDNEPLDVQYERLNDSNALDESMTTFFELMRKSDPKKATFLEDEKNVQFFREIATLFFDKGILNLNFLKIEGKAVATYMNFDFNNDILVYNSGLDYDDYGHLSAGIVLLCHDIKDAIQKERSVFNFLRGDEVYKYRMGGEDTYIYYLRT